MKRDRKDHRYTKEFNFTKKSYKREAKFNIERHLLLLSEIDEPSSKYYL